MKRDPNNSVPEWEEIAATAMAGGGSGCRCGNNGSILPVGRVVLCGWPSQVWGMCVGGMTKDEGKKSDEL